MLAANSDKEKAAEYYKRLVKKYPQSLLSRSGYYWLSKYYDETKNWSSNSLNRRQKLSK